MEHDPLHVEDVLKIDAVNGDPMSGDDAYDMLRYAIMSRPMISEAPAFKGPINTKEWVDFQAKQIENSIDKQIERQQQVETGEDLFNTSGMEQDDVLSYYINKRKA